MSTDRNTGAGRLEKIDQQSKEFRLRDDVGHVVELKQVQNRLFAQGLVGQWVLAEGEQNVTSAGGQRTLTGVRVYETVDPAAEFMDRRLVSLDEILASAPGPDPNGGIELTDEEFAAFTRALHS